MAALRYANGVSLDEALDVRALANRVSFFNSLSQRPAVSEKGRGNERERKGGNTPSSSAFLFRTSAMRHPPRKGVYSLCGWCESRRPRPLLSRASRRFHPPRLGSLLPPPACLLPRTSRPPFLGPPLLPRFVKGLSERARTVPLSLSPLESPQDSRTGVLRAHLAPVLHRRTIAPFAL